MNVKYRDKYEVLQDFERVFENFLVPLFLENVNNPDADFIAGCLDNLMDSIAKKIDKIKESKGQ